MADDPNRLFGGQTGGGAGVPQQPPRITPFNVPQDIFNAILDVSGGDEDFAAVLAAQLYQETRFRSADLSADDVPTYAQELRDALRGREVIGGPEGGYQAVSKVDQLLTAAMIAARRRGTVSAAAADAYRAALERQSGAGITPGAERAPSRGRMSPQERAASTVLGEQLRQAIRDRAPATPEDVYQLYQDYLGRDPENEGAVAGRVGQPYGRLVQQFAGSPEHSAWLRYGARIKDARSWANNLWRDYLGHEPTNEELRTVVDNRWDQDRTESWLRAQPYAKTTLGAVHDVRRLADRYAQQYVGRGKADEGEVNWLIENGKTSADDVSAFYEQLKGRRETGDPTFAWVGDPTRWRRMRDQLGQLWTQAGLKGPPDPHLVNQAVSYDWSLDDVRDAINALPAPGFGGQVSVGEVNRVRGIAQKWKDQYLPGQSLTHEEMTRFVGMNSDEMRTYYRSLPVAMRREALRYAQTMTPAAAAPRTAAAVAVPPVPQSPQISDARRPTAAAKPPTQPRETRSDTEEITRELRGRAADRRAGIAVD